MSTTINGVIAETYVTQTYGNEGSVPVNASYVFPASTRVSVHGMKMQIGDKAVTARIKEKEEARQEFTAAKSQGKSASLLEQQRPNVFTMKVANIMPGDTVNIELHYTEMLVLTEGTYEFVFPAVVGPRYVSPSSDQKEGGHEWAAAPYQEKTLRPREPTTLRSAFPQSSPLPAWPAPPIKSMWSSPLIPLPGLRWGIRPIMAGTGISYSAGSWPDRR